MMIFTEILKTAIESHLARNGACVFSSTDHGDILVIKNPAPYAADFMIHIYRPGVVASLAGIYVDHTRVSMAKISDEDMQRPDCDPSEIVNVVLKYLIKNRYIDNRIA